MVEGQAENTALFPERTGDRLRAARMKAGLDLSDVATRTRVPLRHLQAIETGDYANLPSLTYSLGFVKAYARAVDEDEHACSDQMRSELGASRPDSIYDSPGFEDADPSRMPSRLLAWTAAALALIVAIGYGVWRSQMATVDEAPVSIEAPSAPVPSTATAPPPPAAPTGGAVVLTATDAVWVRIYDANNKRIFEKEMAKGEQFQVPADADKPQIRTGRAELIAVTIGGRAVPPLGPPERTVKDVGVSAAALLARVALPPVSAAGAPANAAATAQP